MKILDYKIYNAISSAISNHIIILFIFIFLPTIVFSQLNKTDAKGLRQGKWQKKQANGRLLYEGEFKDGKPVGEWKRYHPGGQLKAEITYKGDTAQTVLFDVWRKKIAEGNYVNQKKEGLWEIYKNKQKVADEEYKYGLKHVGHIFWGVGCWGCESTTRRSCAAGS